jgi:hypothetical protein
MEFKSPLDRLRWRLATKLVRPIGRNAMKLMRSIEESSRYDCRLEEAPEYLKLAVAFMDTTTEIPDVSMFAFEGGSLSERASDRLAVARALPSLFLVEWKPARRICDRLLSDPDESVRLAAEASDFSARPPGSSSQ